MTPEKGSYRALIFAPRGRDAAVAADLLKETRVEAQICADFATFETSLTDMTCFVVVTEEALLSADLRATAAWIARQPSWSDLPFIVLTQRGGAPQINPQTDRLSEVLGNVTFLERPFRPSTFISVACTALKGRQRQFDARARLDDIREAEERLRTALLAGHLGSWELDLTNWTLICSDACKAHFGLAADHLFGYEDLLAKVHAEDRAAFHDALQRSIEAGGDFVFEYRNVWSDESLHWGEIRARIVYDGRRHLPRLVGVSCDITDRKLAETNLRQLNETLEARVAMRTAEVEKAHLAIIDEIRQRQAAEEQLRQAQKMEAIGHLTGGVAHDFNNLLAAVMGNLELLRKRVPDDPKVSRLIEGALQGAKRGAALTQRLLAFARRQDLKIEPTDVAALVRGMMDLLERSVGPGVEIAVELSSDLPLGLIDGNQVELALLNLAVNARDAMPDGGKLSITLDLAHPAAGLGLTPGSYLRLTVADNGHGMDAATLQRSIDPFFSTKELGKGTGLGLSMIHGLAVQLNGALQLESELGQGTRAALWLPTTTAAPDNRKINQAELPERNTVSQATILVVDDDALVASSTVDMLEDLGHKVLEATSGAQAVNILQSGCQVDLLITDYMMPGMTGLQLAMAAQAIDPHLLILLASGYADLPDGAEVDFPRLGKPYQQTQLAAEISKLLNERKESGAAHAT